MWIDVQRQWVYLEGIFSGSADIKHLLPVESARFSNINTEFLAVMKKVYKSPFVVDVMNIQGIQKSLERLAELLNKIQKALGEYLERERASFPRFYFAASIASILRPVFTCVPNVIYLRSFNSHRALWIDGF